MDSEHPNRVPPPQTGNPYFDAAMGTAPPEILQAERLSYPYGNDLPGISNINMARGIADAIRVGRRGNPALLAAGIVLLLLLVVGVLVAAVAQSGL